MARLLVHRSGHGRRPSYRTSYEWHACLPSCSVQGAQLFCAGAEAIYSRTRCRMARLLAQHSGHGRRPSYRKGYEWRACLSNSVGRGGGHVI
jgi:hypothetical protein